MFIRGVRGIAHLHHLDQRREYHQHVRRHEQGHEAEQDFQIDVHLGLRLGTGTVRADRDLAADTAAFTFANDFPPSAFRFPARNIASAFLGADRPPTLDEMLTQVPSFFWMVMLFSCAMIASARIKTSLKGSVFACQNVYFCNCCPQGGHFRVFFEF